MWKEIIDLYRNPLTRELEFCFVVLLMFLGQSRKILLFSRTNWIKKDIKLDACNSGTDLNRENCCSTKPKQHQLNPLIETMYIHCLSNGMQ